MGIKFDREKGLVKELLTRLTIDAVFLPDPNAGAHETGVDVTIRLSSGGTIGIQVTELDPHPGPGVSRGHEKKVANSNQGKPYFGWAQSREEVILSTFTSIVARKADISQKHFFDRVDEVWLLVCAGVPEWGAIISTFISTPALDVGAINASTDHIMRKSRYSRGFLLPIIGTEEALYKWDRRSKWTKSVRSEVNDDLPRQAYVDELARAASAHDWNEVERLEREEIRRILNERDGNSP